MIYKDKKGNTIVGVPIFKTKKLIMAKPTIEEIQDFVDREMKDSIKAAYNLGFGKGYDIAINRFTNLLLSNVGNLPLGGVTHSEIYGLINRSADKAERKIEKDASKDKVQE